MFAPNSCYSHVAIIILKQQWQAFFYNDAIITWDAESISIHSKHFKLSYY